PRLSSSLQVFQIQPAFCFSAAFDAFLSVASRASHHPFTTVPSWAVPFEQPLLFSRRYVMGELRDRMVRELRLRRYAAPTQKSYLEAVKGLAKHYWLSPDQLTAEQV